MSLFVDDDVALMQQYDNLWSEKKYFFHSIQINGVNNLQLISERLFTFGFAQTRSVAPLCQLLLLSEGQKWVHNIFICQQDAKLRKLCAFPCTKKQTHHFSVYNLWRVNKSAEKQQ